MFLRDIKMSIIKLGNISISKFQPNFSLKFLKEIGFIGLGSNNTRVILILCKYNITSHERVQKQFSFSLVFMKAIKVQHARIAESLHVEIVERDGGLFLEMPSILSTTFGDIPLRNFWLYSSPQQLDLGFGINRGFVQI